MQPLVPVVFAIPAVAILFALVIIFVPIYISKYKVFEKIKKYHFRIEDIYGAAMDFDAQEQFTYEFCNKIL